MIMREEKIAFQDTLTAISDEMIAPIYSRIAPEGRGGAAGIRQAPALTAEEIAVFEAADASEAAQRLKQRSGNGLYRPKNKLCRPPAMEELPSSKSQNYFRQGQVRAGFSAFPEPQRKR